MSVMPMMCGSYVLPDSVPTSELVEMSAMYAAAELSEWDEFAGSGAYVHTTLFGRHVLAEVLRRDSHGSFEVAGLDGLIFYVRIDEIVPVSPEESAMIERSEAHRMREKARFDALPVVCRMCSTRVESGSYCETCLHEVY